MEKRYITEEELQKVKWFDNIEEVLNEWVNDKPTFDENLYTDIKQAGKAIEQIDFIVNGCWRDGRCSVCGQNPCGNCF